MSYTTWCKNGHSYVASDVYNVPEDYIRCPRCRAGEPPVEYNTTVAKCPDCDNDITFHQNKRHTENAPTGVCGNCHEQYYMTVSIVDNKLSTSIHKTGSIIGIRSL